MINYIILLLLILFALYTKNNKILKFSIILLIYFIITNSYETFSLNEMNAYNSIKNLPKCPEFNENKECNLTYINLPDLKCKGTYSDEVKDINTDKMLDETSDANMNLNANINSKKKIYECQDYIKSLKEVSSHDLCINSIKNLQNFKTISDVNKYLPLLKCDNFENVAGFALSSNSIELITPSTKMYKLNDNLEILTIDEANIKIKCFVIFNNFKVICYSEPNLKGHYREFDGHFNTNSEYFNFKEYSHIEMIIKSIKIKTLNKIEYLVSDKIDYRYKNQMLPIRYHNEKYFPNHPNFYSRSDCINKCTMDPKCEYIITKNVDAKEQKCFLNDPNDKYSQYFMKNQNKEKLFSKNLNYDFIQKIPNNYENIENTKINDDKIDIYTIKPDKINKFVKDKNISSFGTYNNDTNDEIEYSYESRHSLKKCLDTCTEIDKNTKEKCNGVEYNISDKKYGTCKFINNVWNSKKNAVRSNDSNIFLRKYADEKKSDNSKKKCINKSSIQYEKEIISESFSDPNSDDINIYHKVPASVKDNLFTLNVNIAETTKYCNINKILLTDNDEDIQYINVIDNKKHQEGALFNNLCDTPFNLNSDDRFEKNDDNKIKIFKIRGDNEPNYYLKQNPGIKNLYIKDKIYKSKISKKCYKVLDHDSHGMDVYEIKNKEDLGNCPEKKFCNDICYKQNKKFKKYGINNENCYCFNEFNSDETININDKDCNLYSCTDKNSIRDVSNLSYDSKKKGYYLDNIYKTGQDNMYIQFKDKINSVYNPLYKYGILNSNANLVNNKNNIINEKLKDCKPTSKSNPNIILTDDVIYPDTIKDLPIIGSWLDKNQLDENYSSNIYKKKLNKVKNDIVYDYVKNDNLIIFRNINKNYKKENIKKIKLIFNNDVIINKIFIDIESYNSKNNNLQKNNPQQTDLITNDLQTTNLPNIDDFNIINYITEENIEISSDKNIDKLIKDKIIETSMEKKDITDETINKIYDNELNISSTSNSIINENKILPYFSLSFKNKNSKNYDNIIIKNIYIKIKVESKQIENTTNEIAKLNEIQNDINIYPIKLELYSGADKEVQKTRIIQLKSKNSIQFETDLVPGRYQYNSITGKRDYNINKFKNLKNTENYNENNNIYGLSNYPRTWVKLDNTNEEYYCSYYKGNSSSSNDDTKSIDLVCKKNNNEKTLINRNENNILNTKFLNINNNKIKKHCTCIEKNDENDKLKLKCLTNILAEGEIEDKLLPINIPNINTCEELMKNDKLLNDYLKGNKLSYCYDKHSHINNSDRYIINAGYNNAGKLRLLKNIEINGKKQIMFCEINDINKSIKYDKFCLINKNTFPGFDFSEKSIDSIIQINESIIYLLQYFNGVLNCIKYDIVNNYKICKPPYMYPLSFSFEFNYTIEEKIVGGFYLNNIIYFFTKDKYLEYFFYIEENKKSNNGLKSSLKLIKDKNSIFYRLISYKNITSIFRYKNDIYVTSNDNITILSIDTNKLKIKDQKYNNTKISYVFTTKIWNINPNNFMNNCMSITDNKEYIKNCASNLNKENNNNNNKQLIEIEKLELENNIKNSIKIIEISTLSIRENNKKLSNLEIQIVSATDKQLLEIESELQKIKLNIKENNMKITLEKIKMDNYKKQIKQLSNEANKLKIDYNSNLSIKSIDDTLKTLSELKNTKKINNIALSQKIKEINKCNDDNKKKKDESILEYYMRIF